MKDNPKYIVVAGVNGAGKSSLYRMNQELSAESLFHNSQRINADEILVESGGDWTLQKDNAASMKEAIKRMKKAMETGQSFHYETTFAGGASGHLKRLNDAKKLGYDTSLLYVGLSSDDLAVKRVKERVRKGGHGIDEQLIRKRYKDSVSNLAEVGPHFDELTIFDNTDIFQQIYRRKNGKTIIDKSLEIDSTKRWFPRNLIQNAKNQNLSRYRKHQEIMKRSGLDR